MEKLGLFWDVLRGGYLYRRCRTGSGMSRPHEGRSETDLADEGLPCLLIQVHYM